MGLYFTSDLHLGHIRALEIMPHRPWTTVDDMNQGIIDNYNSVVKTDDICIFLGDVVMGKKFENVPKFLPQLNGIKALVCGNHDWLAEETKPDKIKQLEDMYSKWFSGIYHGCIALNTIIPAMPTGIQLCHFPLANTNDPRTIEYDQRYNHLRPTISDGDWLLHGHTHAREHITSPNIIHVGVDAAAWDFKPVGFDKILGIMNEIN